MRTASDLNFRDNRSTLLCSFGAATSSISGEELCRTCISIRTVMLGHNHALTLAAQETLVKLFMFVMELSVWKFLCKAALLGFVCPLATTSLWHLFLQGGNGPGDTGLVLPTTDAKPRLNWTPELHECFIEAVNQLGGADSEARPNSNEAHVNSRAYHVPPKNPSSGALPKLAKCCMAAAARERVSGATGVLMSNTNLSSQTIKSLQISEAIQTQIEVQKRLHEQLEVQRHLQLRIEAQQGKYLQSVLEKAQETLV
ncbi:hypothetical protein NE237_012368 [Protea cynaroides]|uniref:MYB-CC type transcription factor LHEQLE-containing domain-containing protein n=1 Tax=Protea cynaroides TaxID=273540 RepID=A0A9Q0H008_9MAGN|nr:hypothetical protein NE237_012368 [Protea cynaroides]